MGRTPCTCCPNERLDRGAWSALEDKVLTSYIKSHGEGKWRTLPKKAGLKRCGKSCRLRWLNYLKPDIKRGNISNDEEDLIIRLHRLLGNRWTVIAGRLPGRTGNEIKNYWKTTLAKKAKPNSHYAPSKESSNAPTKTRPKTTSASTSQPQVIRTKATRLTRKLVIPTCTSESEPRVNPQTHMSIPLPHFKGSDIDAAMDFGFLATHDEEGAMVVDYDIPFDDAMLNDWTGNGNGGIDNYVASLELESLAVLLDSDDWLGGSGKLYPAS